MSLHMDMEQLIQGGALEKARTLLDKIEDTIDRLYYEARIAFKRDDYDTAVNLAEKMIAGKEDDARGHALLGQALGLKAQNAGAVKGAMLLPKVKKAFTRALELDGENIEALEGLFMLSLFAPAVAGGDEKKAREIMEKTISISPAHSALMEGVWYSKKNDTDKAREAFIRAARHTEENPDVLLRTARFFLEQGILDEADNVIDRFAQATASGLNAMELRADLSRARCQWDEAIKGYESILSEFQSYLPAELKIAVCLKEKGDKDGAREHLENVIRNGGKSPVSGRARQLLKSL